MINSIETGKPTIKNILACMKDSNRYTSYVGPYYELLLAVRKAQSHFEEKGDWGYSKKEMAKKVQAYISENKLA